MLGASILLLTSQALVSLPLTLQWLPCWADVVLDVPASADHADVGQARS